MYNTDNFRQSTSEQCCVNGFATCSIRTVSGTEFYCWNRFLVLHKDDLDLTEPKDSSGKSMGGSEVLRPPTCTTQTILDKVLLSNVV